MESVLCPKDGASYLVMSDQVPFLLYYSHAPAIILSLLFGVFLFTQAKRNIQSMIILLVVVLYSLRSFADLITWATNDSRQVMFFWSMQIFFELAIYIACAYLVYVYFRKRDVPWFGKAMLFSPLAVLAILLPTAHTLSYMVLDEICEASEGVVAIQYVYGVEVSVLLWILGFSVYRFFKTHEPEVRKQQLFFTFGLAVFLVGFSWANIAGSISERWELAQYGEFGMPVFIAFLAYLVVKYRAFNVKLLSVQALAFTLVLLVGSLLFLIRDPLPYSVVSITLILLIFAVKILVSSVEKEIERKEELQKISDSLAVANTELHRLDTAKSEFISIASHQLRTPLTAIKGFVSLLLEGAYGRLEPSVADTLNKVYLANARLMNLVENLLNISRIEAGRIQYQFAPTKLEDILTELHELFILAAHEKGLRLGIALPKTPLPMLSLDGAKIREVVSNVMDNSIKYTEKGDVLVAAEQKGGKVVVTVTDTGVGIDPDDLPHLFKKFERGKDAAQVNVSSTGLGLYVGKSFIEAHGGTIRAESAGKGKGARFILELPVERGAA